MEMTVEALLDSPCPRAWITMTGIDAGTYQLWHRAELEPRQPVRGGQTINGPAALVKDPEVPLGRPVTFELLGPSGELAATANLTVPAESAWLHAPTDINSAVPVATSWGGGVEDALAAEALSEVGFDVPAGMSAIVGSPIPWASTGIPQSPSFPLTIMSLGSDTALRNLLTTSTILCLRSLPSMEEIPSVVHIITSNRTRKTIVRGQERRYVWSMTARQVAPPALSLTAPEWVWDDLPGLYPGATWNSFGEIWSGRTWFDFQRDPRP